MNYATVFLCARGVYPLLAFQYSDCHDMARSLDGFVYQPMGWSLEMDRKVLGKVLSAAGAFVADTMGRTLDIYREHEIAERLRCRFQPILLQMLRAEPTCRMMLYDTLRPTWLAWEVTRFGDRIALVPMRPFRPAGPMVEGIVPSTAVARAA